MMKRFLLTAFAAGSMLFSACSLSGGSAAQTMTMDRARAYEGMYKAYMEAEERYLNLLFNIERMPDEEELWSMKRDQMMELVQLREMMLNARTELDNAVQEWEKYLIEMKDEAKQDKAGRPNPNFTGKDALRTSPGQLLPGEIHSSKRDGFQ
ncbi:hypothetical protein [uncultured Fibrobacter sp.]|uniref:hypothetical protein n=1 Tax=uncultured Fibrobacter sp. TaxID=261512 RepID=UPI00261289CE|nr:hypothetical protein [uncultured Fibrobacter sp.]